MKARLKIGLASLCILGSTACVTGGTQSIPPSKPKEKLIEKEGQKVVPSQAAVPPTPTGTDLPGLSQRVSNLQQELSDSDIRDATQLYPAQVGTQEEATFTMVQLRLLQRELQQRTGFQMQDLYAGEEAGKGSKHGLSLEKRFQELDMDLVTVVKNNAFLKNLSSLQLTQALLRNTENSPSFQQNMEAAIQEVGSQWATELNSSPPAPTPSTPSPSTTETVETPPAPEAAISAETPASPQTEGAQDLTQSDGILLLAQKMADKGDYKEAIAQATRIPKEDPFHQQAQEKVKLYSNRAVQDLRQRAAEAFASAMPITDPQAKGAYLRQAKSLLEQALTHFPQADQLDTVRENLTVITRDLETVDKSGS